MGAHVPLFPNPDEPYNFNMQNSDPVLSVLNDISKTLKGMNKKLEKLDKLDKLDSIDKKLDKIHDVLVTTKAEISEKAILDLFFRFLKEDGYEKINIVNMDMGEGAGKADFYIEAERDGEKRRFVLEVKNYLENGQNLKLKKILKDLDERATRWKAIPVLGARYMTTSARLQALGMGIGVLAYNSQTNRMELIIPERDT